MYGIYFGHLERFELIAFGWTFSWGNSPVKFVFDFKRKTHVGWDE
jgi:hypothetical protein